MIKQNVCSWRMVNWSIVLPFFMQLRSVDRRSRFNDWPGMRRELTHVLTLWKFRRCSWTKSITANTDISTFQSCKWSNIWSMRQTVQFDVNLEFQHGRAFVLRNHWIANSIRLVSVPIIGCRVLESRGCHSWAMLEAACDLPGGVINV